MTVGVEGSDTFASLDEHYTLQDAMQKDVITVGHRATVDEAARLLSAGDFHALPVLDEHLHLKGVVTSTDLIAFLLERPAEPELPVDMHERLGVVEKVLEAAERYLHSGLAESEHSCLQLAVDQARRGR